MTLNAHNITVRVGKKELLRDVSLSIAPGEIVAVVGPNGAGKSTLLKAITGDIDAQSGAVQMAGRPLDRWSLLHRARVRAILSQSVPLHFAFSVLEVVLMGRSPHINGRESERDYDIAYQALAMAEVGHLAERTYTTLSGGERQRAQFARVLAQIWEPVDGLPRYLLMDEPTNNLDLTHQHSTLKVARKFAGEGVGVLVILHDLNLAAEYADRIVILRDGDLLACGHPEAVLTAETIETAFNMPAIITPHPITGRPLVIPITTPQDEQTTIPAAMHEGAPIGYSCAS